MGRNSSVIPMIKQALEAFNTNGRKLPSTNEGKVNVQALCRLLGLKEDYSQHFHKKDEIKEIVNALATKQGLLPIGSRSLLNVDDNELEQRMLQTSKQAKEDAQAAIEAKSARESLLVELRIVRTDLSKKDLEITALKERLRLIEESGLFVRM